MDSYAAVEMRWWAEKKAAMKIFEQDWYFNDEKSEWMMKEEAVTN